MRYIDRLFGPISTLHQSAEKSRSMIYERSKVDLMTTAIGHRSQSESYVIGSYDVRLNTLILR